MPRVRKLQGMFVRCDAFCKTTWESEPMPMSLEETSVRLAPLAQFRAVCGMAVAWNPARLAQVG